MNQTLRTDIIRELINDSLPEYKLYQNILLSFGFFFAFSLLLLIVFSYLSYHTLFNTFIVISVILGILTLIFYMAFSNTKTKYNTSYHLYQKEIEDILYEGNDLSKSMIIWTFFINNQNSDFIGFSGHTTYSDLLLNSMKNDINDVDFNGNTLLHHILKYSNKIDYDEDYYNFYKIYVSHALLLGANIDIANSNNITVRSLLSKVCSEFISIFEEIEISKSFTKLD